MFNKGLESDEEQEGLLKRLKNIEDKTDHQIKAIEGQKNNQSMKPIGHQVKDKLPKEAVKAYTILVKEDSVIDYQKLDKDFGNSKYEFSIFSPIGKLLKNYLKKILQYWMQKKNKKNFI